jgi:uncharacterized damage-inducible protein DinB
MSRLRAALLVAGLTCVATTGGLSAQVDLDPMAANLVPAMAFIQRSFVSLADAMPAERYGFRPVDGQFDGTRTFAEQVKHVACSNFAFFNEVEGNEPPAGCDKGGPHPADTKAELMAYLRESFDYAQDVVGATTSANVLEPTNGPYGGQSTRLKMTTLAIWHASDHYGQLVVYLRMNGLVPPASRPPGKG